LQLQIQVGRSTKRSHEKLGIFTRLIGTFSVSVKITRQNKHYGTNKQYKMKNIDCEKNLRHEKTTKRSAP